MRSRFSLRQRASAGRLCCLLVVAAVIWNEWLSLEWYVFSWDTDTSANEGDDTLRLLIVADPQLVGYVNEREYFAGLARWDSDRYLRVGFSRALRATSPNLVLFLGDLFDEGVFMSRAHFNLTMERFQSIFRMPQSLQRIYVPGDNDVGGEAEAVNSELVNRFAREFKNNFDPSALHFDNVDFVHLNVFDGMASALWKGTDSDITFLISHAPVTRVYGSVQKTAQRLNPALILSAHDHTAEFYKQQRGSSAFKRSSISSRRIEARVSNSDPVLELQSPTCSYRMGVSSMGYGFLRLTRRKGGETSYHAEFSILWLPGRFPQLIVYGIVVVLAFLCLFKVTIASVLFRRSFRLRLPTRL